MRTKAEVLQEHWGVSTFLEACALRDTVYFMPPPPLDQWVTLKLPYEAPEHPGIPSMDEIEKAMQDNKLTQSAGLFPVCRVGKCVVKWAPERCILQEAENMLFLQEHSQVRTAKLYAAFTVQKDSCDIYYMVSEFVEGETLNHDKWLALDDEDQKLICYKLSEQFRLLRSVPPVEGYYGRVNHQGWSPWFPFLKTTGKEMLGPYQTYEDFVSAMCANAELRFAYMNCEDYGPIYVKFLSRLKSILDRTKSYKPVLTHIDPKFENIIIRPIKGAGGEIKDWEVTLIDWDMCGWLPAFMQ
ncbi:hypothetical protein K505DRAFT_270242, partial [Melanomma pulvis-pyrius CBS 109.77]